MSKGCEVENVLVKVNKFILLTDFVVLGKGEDKDVLIIMARPFLATGRTIIFYIHGRTDHDGI